MNKRKRDRLADDAAFFWAAKQAGNDGCMVWIVLGAFCLLAGHMWSSTIADAQVVTPVYPQPAYTLDDPITDTRLTLATLEGRWTIQLTDPACTTSYTEVMLTAPVDSPLAEIQIMPAGPTCSLDPSVKIFRQSDPCAMRDGACDVDHEPRPQWWDLP